MCRQVGIEPTLPALQAGALPTELPGRYSQDSPRERSRLDFTDQRQLSLYQRDLASIVLRPKDYADCIRSGCVVQESNLTVPKESGLQPPWYSSTAYDA